MSEARRSEQEGDIREAGNRPSRSPTNERVTDPLIEARALTKRFGGFVAVDGIDFSIHTGEAFGFLGPNGAGKSSTMRMIGCVSPVSGGALRVLGLDPEHDGPQIRGRAIHRSGSRPAARSISTASSACAARPT